jgi:hypothetical protein
VHSCDISSQPNSQQGTAGTAGIQPGIQLYPPCPPGSQSGVEPSASLLLEGVVLDAQVMARSSLLPYVGMVLGVIVGRRVGREELLERLGRALRQHSLCRERRIDYVVRVLNQRPP